jgi:hypothetical protein
MLKITCVLLLIFIILYLVIWTDNEENKSKAKLAEIKMMNLLYHFEVCNLVETDCENVYVGISDYGKITINVNPDVWSVDIWYEGKTYKYTDQNATKFINLYLK